MGFKALVPKRLVGIAATKKSNFQKAIQSKKNFGEYLRTPGSKSDPHGSWSWMNEDLIPTPPEKRTWRWWNYGFFYFSLSMDNWTLGSTMIGIGLNWWQAIVVVFLSQLISSIAMAINSRSGEVYHIGYPVVARSVFGMYGAYYVVFARAVMAVVYYAIKLYVGSSFFVNMLTAVFGTGFTNIPNHIPVSVGFTTQQMLAFFLYWLCHIPFTLLRPYQLKWLFTLKMCTVVPSILGLFIFCMVNTHCNIGPGLPRSEALSASQFSWFFMYAINSGLGNTANIITNQPDFSRWSHNHWASVWPQLIANPISVTLSATFGILSTSAINNVWGLELWNQWDLLQAIMERYPTSAVRFAVFLCAAFWALLILGTNVAANMIPFGSDSTMLLPRYINITRGQFLGLILAWAVCPWKIMYSAASFTNFLGGYGLFMASVVGVMTADYYVISKGNIFVANLYDGSRTNPRYYYNKGWNIQAYIAYIAGCAFPFAGFLGTLGIKVSAVAIDLGHIGWVLSYVVSIVFYIAICKIWPTQSQRAIEDMGLGWEAMAKEDVEIDFNVTGDDKGVDKEDSESEEDLEKAV
ncbi:uracil permease-like protein [Leucogyrophana mollusca]|uniref:Uracil permease-like protein n=1 Tax=Leucogyrophana mollusca TaxID=85980 RepID=A0ACB8BL62_9AGAM|nr:uracil permease-like protein [Leucogyrophana mollusca]